MQEELRSIIAGTKKQLEHLRLLGVEGIQPVIAAAPAVQLAAPTEPLTSLFGEIAAAPVKLTRSTETLEQINTPSHSC